MDEETLLDRIDGLEERITKLRGRNHSLWVTILLASVVAIASTTAWFALIGELRVKRLHAESVLIRKHLNKAGLQLRVTDDGYPWLGLRDGDGEVRACLSVGADAPSLYMKDSKGVNRLVLCLLPPEGTPRILAQDSNGAELLELP
jgi:hypothetical protein